MKIWQKALVIFVGCGASAVCTYFTSVYPVWATALGGGQMAILSIVGVLTGFPAKDAT